jgi:hypothetical protein
MYQKGYMYKQMKQFDIIIVFVFFRPIDIKGVVLDPITVCLVDVFSFGNFENTLR